MLARRLPHLEERLLCGHSLLRGDPCQARDLLRGDLNLRATGLVFSTLLSIIPLIAFSFAVLKGLGFHRDLEPLLYEFFRPLGKQATGLTAQVMGFVERTQGGVLGSLGLALLVWTVTGTVQKSSRKWWSSS